MSNSPLVQYTKISKHKNSPRNHAIDKITIHHCAGVLSAETIGNVFGGTREASSNYGIGNDGKIGMYVEEKDRAWTSSSGANDNRAVTIEVSNSMAGGDWPVSDAAYRSLIRLCVDICKRNGIKKLVYDGTPNGSLTAHRMFAATLCPGPYLIERFPAICNEVNAQLNSMEPSTEIGTNIMGESVATAEQLDAYVKSKNPNAPAYGALYISEGNIEGVRGDIAFAQSCLETGNFTFTGDVKPDQNNFAGIGAVGGGAEGAHFSTPQEGIRAQIQHLKAYASTEKPKTTIVDPRYNLVSKGSAPTVQQLSGKWAVPGYDKSKYSSMDSAILAKDTYGHHILNILNDILGTSTEPPAVDIPDTGADTLYRVRKSWADAKSQLGAFSVLNNAKALADKNPGYYVFDDAGNCIYPEKVDSFDVGSIVKFSGGKHYTNANATTGYDVTAGNAKITAISEGAKHPYHIIHTDSSSKVYGWVDADTIGASTEAKKIVVGSKVKVKKNLTYTGSTFKVYYQQYDVIQVSGDRVVIGIGNVVTAAVNIANIEAI